MNCSVVETKRTPFGSRVPSRTVSPIQDRQKVLQRPGEPVGLVDDHSPDVSVLDVREKPLEPLPVHGPATDAEVFIEPNVIDIMELSPLSDLLLLGVEAGPLGLVSGGDSGVGGDRHGCNQSELEIRLTGGT